MQLDSLYFEHIHFTDKNHGWLCDEYGTVYKTTDGGGSWMDVSPNVPGRILHDSRGLEDSQERWQVLYYNMHFLDEDEGFVTGMKMNRQEGFTTGGGSIFHSTDGGRTWASGYTGGKDQLRGLFFLNEKAGWACGFSGRILRRTDGRQNWEEVQVTQNRFRSIAFIDEKVGFVVWDHNAEDGVLYRSDDGGLTWQKCKNNYANLHRIFVVPEKTWIVGKEGTILTRNNKDIR